MSKLSVTLSQARMISALLAAHNRPTELPEVTELPFDEGWRQWDLAVRLRDGDAS